VVLFPDASKTVHVTVVVPIENTLGALLATDATEQLSEVTGTPKFTLNAAHDVFAFTVIFTGAEIVGFVLSITVTN
jgi:hypothetical protein